MPVSIPQLLRQSATLRRLADAAERKAIRQALVDADWLASRAARALGWHPGTLQSVLMPGRRHAEIGDEARERRRERGYYGGRPTGHA